MLKREWGAESNGKLPHLFIPSKIATLVPEFAMEDLPLSRIAAWCLSLQWRTCPWAEHWRWYYWWMFQNLPLPEARRKRSVTAAVWHLALSWRMMGFCTTKCCHFLLSPCEYELFAKVKEPLRGTWYNTRHELIRAILWSIRNINKYGRDDCVRRLPNIWQKIINKRDHVRNFGRLPLSNPCIRKIVLMCHDQSQDFHALSNLKTCSIHALSYD